MATTTFHDYTGDGSDKTFNYTFPTFAQSEVVVQVNQITVDNYTIPNYATSGTLTVTFDNSTGTLNTDLCESDGSPKNGLSVRIFRDTNVDSAKHTYQSGSAVKAGNLNDNQTQILRALQEEQTNTITTDRIKDSAITTAKINADAVTGAKIADDTINSEHYAAGSIDLEHMSANSVDSDQYVDGSIDNAHLANDAVTGAKIATETITADNLALNTITGNRIADDAITSGELAANSVGSSELKDNSVETSHISNSSVTSAKIADGTIVAGDIADNTITAGKMAPSSVTTTVLNADAVTGAKIADDQIDSEHYVAGSIDTEHIGDNQITTAKIDGGAITNAKMADDSVGTDELIDASVNANRLASNAVTTVKIADDAVTTAKMANDSITDVILADHADNDSDRAVGQDHIKSNAVTTAKIADNAVTVAKIADAELSTLAGMQAGTASILAGGTALTSTLTELNLLDGKSIVTTISSPTDAQLPTAQAVEERIIDLVTDVGGFVPIANETSFPAANPDPADNAGTIVSIKALASNLTSNGSGVATIANGAGSGNTVTINGMANSDTIEAGKGILVETTSTLHTYTFHRETLAPADITTAQTAVNDFNARYRVNAGEPTSSLDDGDLVWDTNADKMKVYDATASAWKEVTSAGDFKYLFLCPAGGTGAPTLNGSIATYDLRESSNSGSAASVTSAAQLIVSINGIIQKANTGTSAPAEGFALVDANTIIFGANLASGDSVFIVQIGSAVSIPTPGDNTVATAKIQNSAVTTAKLGADAVDGTKIADDAIDSEHIADGAIDNAHMANNSVNSAQIVDGAVTAGEIAANAVGSSEIAADAVDGTKIADDAVGAEHIQQLDADLSFADSAKAKFGAGNDLEIYHNGSDSYIVDSGTGNLIIRGESIVAIQDTSGNAAALFNDGGAVDLYHNGSKKIETTANGITVTGRIDAAADSTHDIGTSSVRFANGYFDTLYGDGSNLTGVAGGVTSDGSGNTHVGSNAGNSDNYSSALNNTCVGKNAGTAITTADHNTLVGKDAGDSITSGSGNTALGTTSLITLTDGTNNVALGKDSLGLATSCNYNVAAGVSAMYETTDGHSCVAIGYEALKDNTQADFNVAIGRGAMSLQTNTGAGYNIAIGGNAYKGANSTEHNIAIGYEAMGKADTSGSRQVAIGNQALENVTSGSDNIAIGHHAMEAITTGNNTVAIGVYAGEAVSDGVRNVFIGHQSGKNATSNQYCTFVGYDAGRDCTGSHNTFIGHLSGVDNPDTIGNTCVGSYTMTAGTSGDATENTCVGYAAGYNLTSGDSNTCIGNSAGKDITTGSNNLMLGKNAGRSDSPVGSVTTASNDICLGDNNIDNLYCDDTSISSSDQRDKVDVETFTHGLKWVNQLRPVTYRWDKRTWYNEYDQWSGELLSSKSPDGSKKKPKKHIGFLAQEVLAVEQGDGFAQSKQDMLVVNLNNDDSAYGLKYERLVPVLVNAIKELSDKNDALEARIATLEAK